MSRSEFDVTVESADPLAELTIVDARYKTLARGFGELVCKLPAGLYVARSRSGEKTEQKMVRVSDRAEVVRFDMRGELRSSAPVDESFDHARDVIINASPRVAQDANAWVVLALRHAIGTETTPAFLPVHSTAGFELLSRTSTTPIEFAGYPLTQTPSGHWAIALRVAEGWYELQIPGDEGSHIRLSLYAGAEFSPTVFVELRASRTEGLRPDLDRLLVSYDRQKAEMFRDDDRMRAIELARRSLVVGRNSLTPALMKILYKQKFADPMLGLFAAYLLLNDPKGEEHFEEVVRNTGEIFEYPQHPDLVIARALGRQKGWLKNESLLPGDREPLVAPPLLRASWDGMLELKDRSGEVVASDYWRGIAATLSRSNVWVLWRPSSTGTGRSEAASLRRPSESANALFTGLVASLRTNPELASKLRSHEGGKLFRSIVRTALELTTESDVKIPRGYTKRFAHALSVPESLLADEIHAVGEVLGAKLKGKKA